MIATPLPCPGGFWWKWTVCGLLLLATMLNYMDRIALNQTSKRVMTELEFKEKGYGALESGFGIAVAVGAIISGFAADSINVRWLYPIIVVMWSLAGAATLMVHSFEQLLVCRLLLGFFEAANWPCAIRTTHWILSKEERTLGNSILQSGAAFGSIFTPPLVWASLHFTGSWRLPFGIVGLIGIVWSVAWIIVVRYPNLTRTAEPSEIVPTESNLDVGRNVEAPVWPRFLALVIMVVFINATWHFLRAWMPLFLQDSRGYAENSVFWVSTAYYVAAGIGSIGAGFFTSNLISRGISVHRSRMAVFLFFALLTLLSFAAAFLHRGPLLIVVLLVLGFASLGVFPNYYSFTQELSSKHQGKITGVLGFTCWAGMFVLHLSMGNHVETSKARYLAEALARGLNEEQAKLFASWQAYQWSMALIGILPLLSFLAMLLLWNRGRSPAASELATKKLAVPRRLSPFDDPAYRVEESR